MSNISGALKEEMDKISFKINDVVQINEYGPEGWIGCLAFVEEVKDIEKIGKFKIPKRLMIGIEIPHKGTAFLFVKSEQVDKIGKMALIRKPKK